MTQPASAGTNHGDVARRTISAIGLGTFDKDLKVPDGAVFSMNPDEVPEAATDLPEHLQGVHVVTFW